MKTYEYKTVGTITNPDLVGELNDLGAQGWHVVHQMPPDGYNNTKLLLERETTE